VRHTAPGSDVEAGTRAQQVLTRRYGGRGPFSGRLGSVDDVPALPLPLSPLADELVLLRRWDKSDIPAMLAAFEDAWFQRFSDWAPADAEAARAYQAKAERDRRRGRGIDQAVVRVESPGLLLGGASLHDVDLHQGTGAVGFWLVPAARGQGAASRAVRLIAGWAFAELGLARLEITCAPDNEASQRVALRCGFSREGVLRSHLPFKGGRRDSVLFSLLAGELS
jgi:RimJ/RimL family protein N-acetyltransferase